MTNLITYSTCTIWIIFAIEELIIILHNPYNQLLITPEHIVISSDGYKGTKVGILSNYG